MPIPFLACRARILLRESSVSLRDSPKASSARSRSLFEIDLVRASFVRWLWSARASENSADGFRRATNPTACAMRSMCRSIAKRLCGAPNPRNAPCGGAFVATALARMRIVGPVVGTACVNCPARKNDGRQASDTRRHQSRTRFPRRESCRPCERPFDGAYAKDAALWSQPCPPCGRK